MLYFVAIVAPVHINDEVLVWKRYMEEHYGCKVALRSPAHITLVPPFSMSAEKEAELNEHLSGFATTQKSFTVSLQHFDSFPPRVIFVKVIPGEPLLQVKQSLDEYLQPLKNFLFKKEQRSFHPHITIANRDLSKGDYKKSLGIFQDPAV